MPTLTSSRALYAHAVDNIIMMMVRDPELVLAVSHRQHVHIDDAKPIGAEGSCRG